MTVKREKYFTIEEITEKLSLSKDTIMYWIRGGNLKIYVSETDLENFLAKKKEDEERSKRLRKKTEERYKAHLKKTSQVDPYKKYNGKPTEL